MKLSAPIYVLKSQAKELKRTKQITMVEALNQIAQREGFSSWSLLQSKAKDLYPRVREDILGYLNPGDLFLIASRPGLGKTTLADSLPLRTIRFAITSVAGINPVIGLAVGAIDNFFVDKWLSGYSPKLLLDELSKLFKGKTATYR